MCLKSFWHSRDTFEFLQHTHLGWRSVNKNVRFFKARNKFDGLTNQRRISTLKTLCSYMFQFVAIASVSSEASTKALSLEVFGDKKERNIVFFIFWCLRYEKVQTTFCAQTVLETSHERFAPSRWDIRAFTTSEFRIRKLSEYIGMESLRFCRLPFAGERKYKYSVSSKYMYVRATVVK